MEFVMLGKETESLRKRMKPDVKEKEEDPGHNAIGEMAEKEETEADIAGSVEMGLHITHILVKIECFTQLVSELLESGKTMFKELSDEFEERLIMIHKEQMEKWQDEIKEIRLLDASNEEVNVTLRNAQYLLQNPHVDS
ncbi:hypothetical protein BT93_A1342 [Corymbia citriodora subsp. variegata]|nr:hypothetical protein BT93_A1342 [Corymbia citriodora subsp. variegata]KAF8042977.1 hypothetical protein BT93_A1342 [Corymbia citriodora subsp. variegata]